MRTCAAPAAQTPRSLRRYPTSRQSWAGGVIPAQSQPIKLAIHRLSDSSLFVRQRISDVADVREHLLAEQFERFHQLVWVFRARGLKRQIDDAAADLSAGLLQLRDDLVPAAAPRRRRCAGRLPTAWRRPGPSAGIPPRVDTAPTPVVPSLGSRRSACW